MLLLLLLSDLLLLLESVGLSLAGLRPTHTTRCSELLLNLLLRGLLLLGIHWVLTIVRVDLLLEVGMLLLVGVRLLLLVWLLLGELDVDELLDITRGLLELGLLLLLLILLLLLLRRLAILIGIKSCSLLVLWIKLHRLKWLIGVVGIDKPCRVRWQVI